MSATAKCSAKGCPGRVVIDSNGHGAVHERCACCERRAEWKRRNLPEVATVVCAVCGGSFVVAARGAGRAKHCPACKPLILQKQRNTWREQHPTKPQSPALVRSA